MHFLQEQPEASHTLLLICWPRRHSPDAGRCLEQRSTLMQCLPTKVNGNFLIKKNFSIAQCNGVAFLNNNDFLHYR